MGQSDRREEIEQLREDSEPEQTDTPLAYEVEEYSKGTGSWGRSLPASASPLPKSTST